MTDHSSTVPSGSAPHVFLLTGEPSGDLHGARLAQALLARDPRVRLSGVGGTRMRQAGVQIEADSEHWGAIGIPEALRKVPSLLGHLHRLTRRLLADPPDVLVLIDFGAFNMRLLRQLQGSGIRTVYYIPPGCWSRRRAPGQLPFLADAIATPFPWSAASLSAAGGTAQVQWVGHPILEYTRQAATPAEARARLGIDPAQPVVAVAPGSRRAELRYLLPVFRDALARLHPRPTVLLALAPSLDRRAVTALLPPDLPVHYLDGIDYAVMRAADAALVASGTATLELACLDIPMVVAYRASFATWLQYRLVARHITHISLPNILCDAPVVPELLQHAASPAALADALAPLLTDTPARRAQRTAFAALRETLGDGQACAKTAEMVLKLSPPGREPLAQVEQ